MKQTFCFIKKTGNRNANGHTVTTVNIFKLTNNSPTWFAREKFQSGGLELFHAVSEFISTKIGSEEFSLFDLEKIVEAQEKLENREYQRRENNTY